MKYSLFSQIQLAYFVIRTKLIWKSARIIRFPFRMRGKEFIRVGKGFTTGFNCRIDAFPLRIQNYRNNICIKIGNNFQMNDNVHIAAVESIQIGNNVLIASKVFISDHDHGFYGDSDIHDPPESIPKNRQLSFKAVVIEDNVWIGQGVSILKGVRIGFGSIIGANSVVNKSIPPKCVAVGSPAKVVKKYNEKSLKWEKIS